jgi:RNA polymerase sigma factor (sigma-70 family)
VVVKMSAELADLRSRLARFARRRGVRDAEDVAQDALLVLLRERARVKPGLESAFAHAVVARMVPRARKRERDVRACGSALPLGSSDDSVDELAEMATSHDVPHDVETCLDELRRAALVRDRMCSLPDDLRPIVELFEREGLGKDEVAQRLALPVGTCSSRRARARRWLTGELGRAEASRAKPCVGARASLFVVGRTWYEARGLWGRYRKALPTSLRDHWEEKVSSTWVDLDAVMGFYSASQSLGLSRQDELSLGARLFDRVARKNGFVPPRPRTAAEVLEHASDLWFGTFEGGRADVHARSHDEQVLELEAPMFVHGFFRHCLIGAVGAALVPTRARLTVERTTSRTLRLVART